MLQAWKQIAKLSIFVRLTLGYLTIMGLVIGVNWFILNQLRTLSELGTELVSYYYPTVETGKRLLTSLLVQLKSDKQYLVLRDTSLLKEFLQEAGQFKKPYFLSSTKTLQKKSRHYFNRFTIHMINSKPCFSARE
ncbi:MAG: hypothetical protein IH978_03455 [Nitrospinae bacterium]|nr:hypothetical protein [Nitrospinota bacterium]